MGGITNIGASIRNMRRKMNITLKELSERSHLSIGYLSNLERNLSSPTLANLQKICEVLHTSVGDLLERSDQERIIIRKEENTLVDYREEKLQVGSIDFGEEFPLFQVLHLGPCGGTSLVWNHDFSEIGYVVSGTMITKVADAEYELHPGDSVLIRAGTDHAIHNLSDTPCISFWYRERKKKQPRKKN